MHKPFFHREGSKPDERRERRGGGKGLCRLSCLNCKRTLNIMILEGKKPYAAQMWERARISCAYASLVGARAVLLLSPSFSLSATEAITPVQIQRIRCSPCPGCCSPRPRDLSVPLSNSSRTIKKILQLLWGWEEAGSQRENSLSARGQP